MENGFVFSGAQNNVDRLLDAIESRIAALEQSIIANDELPKVGTEAREDELLPRKKSEKTKSKHILNGGKHSTEETLKLLGEQLHSLQDSSSYVKAKKWLIETHGADELIDLIKAARDTRAKLTSWDRIASCVLAALKDSSMENLIALEGFVGSFTEELARHFDNADDGGGVEPRAADGRLLKRILETLPETSQVRTESCERIASAFSKRASPMLRAIAVDIANLSLSDDFAKKIAMVCLAPDAHRLVEEAVRRVASSSTEREITIGWVLVSSLLEHRPAELAFISRTAKRFNVENMFEGLGELGERERVRGLVKHGVNKALGLVTLKPEKKWIVLATLVEEGHHLTARRIARDRPRDDQLLMELFGVEIDDDAADMERQLRFETCVRVPDDTPIIFIDNTSLLLQHQDSLLNSLGPLSLDVEWLPEMNGKQGMSPAQIMQLGRMDGVYLFDIAPNSKLRLTQEFDLLMLRLLERSSAIWGFGLEMDIKVLAKSFPSSTWCHELRRKARNLGNAPNESLKSLSERVLGKTVDKEQQMSDWGRRPLYPEQIEYAAADAYVLLQLQLALFSSPNEVIPSRSSSEQEDEPGSRSLKFFCDETLKRVAKMLRAVNVDCGYEPCGGKRANALKNRLARAKAEGRMFLTADAGLRDMRHVYVVQATDNEERFHELVQHFNIPLDPSLILLRCTKCNGPGFEVISKDEARARKPSVVTDFVYNNEAIGEFFCCTTCANVVWQGKKFREVQSRMERLIDSTIAIAHGRTNEDDDWQD